MSQLQKFLYTHASKPLVDKEKKVNLIPKEEADPNVRRQPICVNRFAGFSKQSDIHIEDYSSCIYCDVEPGRLIKSTNITVSKIPCPQILALVSK